MPPAILYKSVYSLFTLYMLLLLLRWFSPWLGLEVESGRLRWIARIGDPLIKQMRRIIPSLGPADFGPVCAVLLVWLLREVSLRLIWSYMSA